MNNAIIVSFGSDIKDVKNRFLRAGCPSKAIKMFAVNQAKNYPEKLVELIKKVRSTGHIMVIIHGQLPEFCIQEIYDNTTEAKWNFGIDLDLYAFEAPIKLPGVQTLTDKEIAEKLNEKAA